MNAKKRGISYVADIKNKFFMVVGVNSSRYKGKRTGVAITSTINDTYTDFYNKEEIIEEEHYKDRLHLSVSSFVEEALGAYKEKNEDYEPKGIIIYKQSVSLQQKNFLSNEIKKIEDLYKKKKIKFYYVLVNTKTTFKFFDVQDNIYYNPYSGLLVIEGITNKNFFEFYIQPQEVTQGSATPTCFNVAYGDLDMPEMIPKFTFDLCHFYSNWQGPVRIPNVLKAAEKLSKMTAKYKLGELNEKLKYGRVCL